MTGCRSGAVAPSSCDRRGSVAANIADGDGCAPSERGSAGVDGLAEMVAGGTLAVCVGAVIADRDGRAPPKSGSGGVDRPAEVVADVTLGVC